VRGRDLPGRGGLPGDLVVVAWLVLWIAVGLAVADAVTDLRTLSDTASDTGRAIGDSADALGSLGDTPVVGGEISDAADGVREPGRTSPTRPATRKAASSGSRCCWGCRSR